MKYMKLHTLSGSVEDLEQRREPIPVGIVCVGTSVIESVSDSPVVSIVKVGNGVDTFVDLPGIQPNLPW